VVDAENFPNDFEISAIDQHNHIMAFQHKSKPIIGIQFHPESILSDFALEMMSNWINQIE
jgi:anthranilate/para-aminobenzoate synthase component II